MKKAKKALKKKYTLFRTRVFSRHPSHSPLRKLLALLPFKSVVRFGSTTTSVGRIECNTVKAVKTSASKKLMKIAFEKAGVITAQWAGGWPEAKNTEHDFSNLKFPIVAKHIFGSRGTGNYLLKTLAEFETWAKGKTLANYLFEIFHDYSREYRLHVTKDGCFYTCRKMLKNDTPKNKRWFRNDSNSTWVLETNPAFDKPVNWNKIVEESVKALSSVGLDIGAIDVKVQSAKDSKGNARKEPKFIILETNSAPSLKSEGLARYLIQLPLILKQKQQG